jgi:hypothetical protein
MNQMDDFDLLDATIDPMDIRSQQKVQNLRDEIELEKVSMKCKLFFKQAFSPEDPFKITE